MKTVGTPDATPDNTIMMGDLILMSCPREHREAREKLLHKVNTDRLGTASNTVKEAAARAGIELKDAEDKESYELRAR